MSTISKMPGMMGIRRYFCPPGGPLAAIARLTPVSRWRIGSIWSTGRCSAVASLRHSSPRTAAECRTTPASSSLKRCWTKATSSSQTGGPVNNGLASFSATWRRTAATPRKSESFLRAGSFGGAEWLVR